MPSDQFGKRILVSTGRKLVEELVIGRAFGTRSGTEASD
jgi:hypothetical protein